MKIIHIQTCEYGCSYYCIANLLNFDTKEVESALDKISKQPESQMNEFYENQYLRANGYPRYFLTTFRTPKFSNCFIHDPEILHYNSEISEIVDISNSLYTIFLISIEIKEGLQHRLLLLKNTYSNLTYIIDPLVETIEIIECDQVLKKYKVRAVSELVDEGNGKSAKLNYEDIKHLVPLK